MLEKRQAFKEVQAVPKNDDGSMDGVWSHTGWHMVTVRQTHRGAGHVGPWEALQGQEEEFGQMEEFYIIFSFNSL